jgi:ABC-type transport system substrate-binding protein
VADDPIWPFHWAYSAAAQRYTHNPAAARLRLDGAGFRMKTGDSQLGPASRFQFTCLFYSEDPQFERIALMLQRQLSEVGIDMILEPAVLATLAQRLGTGQFDAFLLQTTSGRSFDWTYRIWHSPRPDAPPMQNSGYTGADAILDRLRVAEADSDVRMAVADLQQRFYEDAPAVFIAWPEATRAIDARVDVGRADDPDSFANLWQWRLGTPRVAAR